MRVLPRTPSVPSSMDEQRAHYRGPVCISTHRSTRSNANGVEELPPVSLTSIVATGLRMHVCGIGCDRVDNNEQTSAWAERVVEREPSATATRDHS